jgi:hypothetical protein
MSTSRELQEFAHRYQAEVLDQMENASLSTAGLTSTSDFKENIFTQLVLEELLEAGVIEDCEVCFLSTRFGQGVIKVNGFGVGDDEDRVDLYVTVYESLEELGNVSTDTIRIACERAMRFLKGAISGRHLELEPSSNAAAMTQRIFELREKLVKARIFILSDGLISLKEVSPSEVDSISVTFQVWDMERLFRVAAAGRPHESIEIDLMRDGGSGFLCLPVPVEQADYSSYLCVIPAIVLHALYEEYGSQLLELNVRSFLQARGKVNKGIRETIRSDPHHFFPYNNGLAMTASDVRIGKASSGQSRIEYIRGLQIVNGGQTTASIHRAHKEDKADLRGIFVQGKLTVVVGDHLEEMVPKISKFANSQNAVSEVDFSANHPFHIELARLSASVWVPGEQSRWFYERARGQYQVAKSKEAGTPAQRKRFEQRVPSSQKFTKTDVAKFLNTWDKKPQFVSRGGQKNFITFMDGLNKYFGASWTPDVVYYKELIAKAILFKRTQQIVNQEGFPAYRANIVAYTLSLLSLIAGDGIDLMAIWEKQSVPEPIERTLRQWSTYVDKRILESAEGRNITEWCKKDACWTAVSAAMPSLPAEMRRGLAVQAARGHGRVPLTQEEVAAVAGCRKISSEEWLQVHRWAVANRRLSHTQRGVVLTMASYAAAGWEHLPTAKQARIAVDAALKASDGS